MIDEKRLLEWLRREKFWQNRERKTTPGSALLRAHYQGSAWAFSRTIKWVKGEARGR